MFFIYNEIYNTVRGFYNFTVTAQPTALTTVLGSACRITPYVDVKFERGLKLQLRLNQVSFIFISFSDVYMAWPMALMLPLVSAYDPATMIFFHNHFMYDFGYR